jgi:hypothetical protein
VSSEESINRRIDVEWAPLRAAVPSFAPQWAAWVARPGYDPADLQNVHEFASHLTSVLDSEGLDALVPLIAALEPLYERVAHQLPDARTADTLESILTINIHEHFAGELEERGIDLREWTRHFAGPLTMEGWRRALTWTHPECSWDEVEGLVRDAPLASAQGTFRVSTVRPGADNASLEMRGTLTGDAQPGWYIRQRLSSGHHDAKEIAAVRREDGDGDTVTLVVSCESDDLMMEAEFWKMNDDETHDIVESRKGVLKQILEARPEAFRADVFKADDS